MYVRDAKNRDEAWLLDQIESMGLDDAAFRSRDYVIAVDEESNERAGFGRIRIHKTDGESYCELTGIGVPERWREQGVGAHVIERLIDKAGDQGFETVYSITGEPNYLVQFGFDPVDAGALPDRLRERLEQKREEVDENSVAMRLDVEEFAMPPRLREAFKQAAPLEPTGSEPTETAEDFGIDTENVTYKYDTGR
ncbi:MAG: GNAT family N-acetyltransferase [Haloferacaceae archaeon]